MRRAVSARSRSASDLPMPMPCACRKVLAMPPPITSASTLDDEIFQQVELGRDLGAADDGDHRLLRRVQRLRQRVELGLHGAAGIGGQFVAEAFGRGMRAMRGGEGVVDVDVAELRERRDEGRIVLFFFFVEARVLETENVAVLHRGDGLLGDFADAVLGKADRPVEHVRRVRARRVSSDSSDRGPSGGRNARAGSPCRPCRRFR